jgi:ATP-dependent Lon protease
MNEEAFETPEELPLFPLATVLFPGAILPLHIFEERYKAMMQYAVEHGAMYGLSFRGQAAIGRETMPEIGSVGCLAKINAVMPLEEGKLNILSTGIVRYKVTGYTQMLPFLIARIVVFTDEPEHDDELDRLFEHLFTKGKELVDAAQSLNVLNTPINPSLPEEPEPFSLFISSILPIENETKQALLEMTSTKTRLIRLKKLINDTLPSYTTRLQMQERAKTNGQGKLP